ncbi:MAG: class I SAM-dependent rRNA methyltransferase [Spirochaetaceae bacterium]|jgi:23S rRNA (cytosine1962-C5)-methyltransferase|nr:class I SAM-dependent rRNA methyltransferase [Spirochaetaceae bacterium]
MIARIILTKGEEKRIRMGHPWVYDNEVKRIAAGYGDNAVDAELSQGGIADVETYDKKYLGRAFVNPASKIIARIYSPSKEGVDTGFFKRRIRAALARRSAFDLGRQSCRAVFAEADFLPGLIIDRYVGWDAENINGVNAGPGRPLTFETMLERYGQPSIWFCMQILSFGMDIRREQIVTALNEAAGEYSGLVEKKSVKARALEGLDCGDDTVTGRVPAAGILIFENDFPFIVSLLEGQKTGHFLDQKHNHKILYSMIREKFVKTGRVPRMLDAFCYSGGFAIHAARAGAGQVIAADTSEAALRALAKNALINAVDTVKPLRTDVFDYLEKLERAKECFDIIVLDPPAFAKSHTALDNAIRGYREINIKAIKLLSPGGLLVSCSCSQALDEQRFRRMIASSAADADRRLYELDFRYQSPDHPILSGYDESLYLKCGFYQAV